MIKCTEIGTYKISFKMIEPSSIFSNKVQGIVSKLVEKLAPTRTDVERHNVNPIVRY